MNTTQMPDNPFTRILRRYADLPEARRRRMVSWSVGRAIPMVGAAGIDIRRLAPTRVEAVLGEAPPVQNHIGGMHAAALALLAETVTGLVVALNVPSDGVPLLRALDVSYERRAAPPVEAVAVLTEDEAAHIRTAPVGKIDVPVTLRGATGEAPVTCHLQWAWLPKRRVPGVPV